MMKLQKLTLGPASRSNHEFNYWMQKMIRGGYSSGGSGDYDSCEPSPKTCWYYHDKDGSPDFDAECWDKKISIALS